MRANHLVNSSMPLLLLMANTSTDDSQELSGLGVVLATCDGEVLTTWRAQARRQYADTSPLELAFLRRIG